MAVDGAHAGDVDRVVEALERGEVVAIPTDTVYGLAADPRSPKAMRRLFELKARPQGVPVAVLVASVDQARSLIRWTRRLDDLANAHWPGALTIVGASVVEGLHLGSVDTIGVRVPDHPLVLACAQRFGPIATTSANKHGQPTIVDPEELAGVFGEDLHVVVDGGMLDGTASTVVDASVEPMQILRQGRIDLDRPD